MTCAVARSERTRAAALAAGVQLLPRLEDVVARSDLVVSLVPQTAVIATADAFVEALAATARRPLYLDANSVSPATMEDVCRRVSSADVACVDGAFVGNSSMLGRGTVLYLSGTQATGVWGLLAEALHTRILGPKAGTASAFKLCMYGFNKGLVALFLEMAAAADRLGQSDELKECLRAFYPGSLDIVERLLPTYPRHAARRAEELTQVVQWLQSIGQRGDMAAASRSVIQEFARLGLPTDDSWDVDGVLRECGRRHFLAGE